MLVLPCNYTAKAAKVQSQNGAKGLQLGILNAQLTGAGQNRILDRADGFGGDGPAATAPVSYTHLDVYKRQAPPCTQVA